MRPSALFLFLSACLCAVACGGDPTGSDNNDASGPGENTSTAEPGPGMHPAPAATAFFDALMEGAIDEAAAHALPGQRDMIARAFGDGPPEGATVEVTTRNPQIDGDRATVDVRITITRADNAPESRNLVVDLARHDREWRVDLRSMLEDELENSLRMADAFNLKRLAGTLIRSMSRGRPHPEACGKRFWVALFVGEGPDGRLQLDPADARPGLPDAVRLLISPADQQAMEPAALLARLQEVVESGEGVAGLSDEEVDRMCSYAGPATTDGLIGRGTMIIGCTGTRNGESLFDDGFAVVTNRGEATFRTFGELGEDARPGTGSLESVKE